MSSDPQDQDLPRPTSEDSADQPVADTSDAADVSDVIAQSDPSLETNDSAADEPSQVDPADQPSADTEQKPEGAVEQDSAAEEDAAEEDDEPVKQWYILKVQQNREPSIRDALARRVKINGLDEYFEEMIVPTEDVAEFNKNGKRRIVKRKLYPGYIMVHMVLNDDTWFLVRETPGVGDFTGSAGKPSPMEPHEVQRMINLGKDADTGETQIKTAIPFKIGDRVRVKEGNFLNFEGEVSEIDEANGRVTVMINIFGRSTPVELEHWQIESV